MTRIRMCFNLLCLGGLGLAWLSERKTGTERERALRSGSALGFFGLTLLELFAQRCQRERPVLFLLTFHPFLYTMEVCHTLINNQLAPIQVQSKDDALV